MIDAKLFAILHYEDNVILLILSFMKVQVLCRYVFIFDKVSPIFFREAMHVNNFGLEV